MKYGDLQPQYGEENRVSKEAADLMKAGCGVSVTRTIHGLVATGIDRSNRDRQLPRVEKR
jgi:hypothetical protein